MAAGAPHVAMVEGDALPRIAGELVGVDLDLYSSITLRLRLEDGSLVEKTATIVSADDGTFRFDLDAADLPAGNHVAEIIFVLAAGGYGETWPADAPIDVVVRAGV